MGYLFLPRTTRYQITIQIIKIFSTYDTTLVATGINIVWGRIDFWRNAWVRIEYLWGLFRGPQVSEANYEVTDSSYITTGTLSTHSSDKIVLLDLWECLNIGVASKSLRSLFSRSGCLSVCVSDHYDTGYLCLWYDFLVFVYNLSIHWLNLMLLTNIFWSQPKIFKATNMWKCFYLFSSN